MNDASIYILIAIIALAGIVIISILKGKEIKKPFSPLAAIAFAFVIAGIAFGTNRMVGYGLMSTGVIIAIIDVIIRLKVKKS